MTDDPEERFWYRLGIAMGEPNIAQLKHQITYRQFRGWVEYYQVEPWGEERADLRAGIISAAVRNSMRSKGPAFKVSDFIPKFGPRKSSQSEDEVAARVLGYCRAHNAKVRLARGGAAKPEV